MKACVLQVLELRFNMNLVSLLCLVLFASNIAVKAENHLEGTWDFVKTHAPRVYLAKDDKFCPCTLTYFADHTYLTTEPSPKAKGTVLWAITGQINDDNPIEIFPWFFGQCPPTHQPPIYALVFPDPSVANPEDAIENPCSHKLIVSYMVFSAYNLGKSLAEINKTMPMLGMYDSHLGDIERVWVEFDGCVPQKITYSAHASFQKVQTTLAWSEVNKVEGTHPVVFSADGSHGLYPKAGHILYNKVPPLYDDTNNKGPVWDTWKDVEVILPQEWATYSVEWGVKTAGEPKPTIRPFVDLYHYGDYKAGDVLFGQAPLMSGATGFLEKLPLKTYVKNLMTSFTACHAFNHSLPPPDSCPWPAGVFARNFKPGPSIANDAFLQWATLQLPSDASPKGQGAFVTYTPFPTPTQDLKIRIEVPCRKDSKGREIRPVLAPSSASSGSLKFDSWCGSDEKGEKYPKGWLTILANRPNITVFVPVPSSKAAGRSWIKVRSVKSEDPNWKGAVTGTDKTPWLAPLAYINLTATPYPSVRLSNAPVRLHAKNKSPRVTITASPTTKSVALSFVVKPCYNSAGEVVPAPDSFDQPAAAAFTLRNVEGSLLKVREYSANTCRGVVEFMAGAASDTSVLDIVPSSRAALGDRATLLWTKAESADPLWSNFVTNRLQHLRVWWTTGSHLPAVAADVAGGEVVEEDPDDVDDGVPRDDPDTPDAATHDDL